MKDALPYIGAYVAGFLSATIILGWLTTRIDG